MQQFLIRQPIWHLNEDDPELRWEMGVVEDDPTEESQREQRPRKGVVIRRDRRQLMDRGAEPEETAEPKWELLDRDDLVRNVLADSPDDPVRPWHRVALVSGAGLGKTANLQWLASRINQHEDGRDRQVAIFTPLRDLPVSSETLPEFVYQWLIEYYGQNPNEHETAMLKEVALRLLKQGRVLFLLDSLDEAGAAENSPAITKLKQLMNQTWQRNPVWVSGRPYAFRATEKVLCDMVPAAHWNFVRIGPLNEPEARQLVETAGRA